MKSKAGYKCACTCECPIAVLDTTGVVCEHCKDDNHWDPMFNMDWAKTFVWIVIVVAIVVMAAFLLSGGIAPGLAQ